MKLTVCGILVALLAVCYCVEKKTSPKVQLYSHQPGEFGQKNVLICHVSDFYPPNLKITLLKDDVEITRCNQTDLAFKSGWHFHLTKTADFTPQKGEQYTCRIEHGDSVNTFLWESNM
ncbi:beta-2-microglobulin-like [Halichoeres trimaculatus]|uniref:beta-2-microglobulin-like n=1 Tax=Halichoeres trimaculatus TaxID=147232 RepID=UPI003D9EC31C